MQGEVGFSQDDQHHIQQMADEVIRLKAKEVSIVFAGTLPDCGDSFVIASEVRLAIARCAASGSDEDES